MLNFRAQFVICPFFSSDFSSISAAQLGTSSMTFTSAATAAQRSGKMLALGFPELRGSWL